MAQFYNPSHFRVDEPAKLHAFISRFPFATLITAGTDGASVSHLPLLLETPGDGPTRVIGHIARANPHWKEFGEGREGLAIFHGPQAYVTPQWYASKRAHGKVVPTWNYAVVHARGPVRAVHDRDWLHRLVNRLTDAHERPTAAPWAVGDAPEDYVEKMLTAIVGVELTVAALDGKWKLSQNRDARDYAGVRDGLAARGDADSLAVRALMEPD